VTKAVFFAIAIGFGFALETTSSLASEERPSIEEWLKSGWQIAG
jgi:hypothetical protein